ncbi:MAG: hypothetical protein IPI57_20600 [Candidatus Competibacteraceae bacterium]|nr:hypothetical protein [Candidatus Competibacteraceae bacterium]
MIDEQINTPDTDDIPDASVDSSGESEASYYLRDLTEDDVYSRLATGPESSQTTLPGWSLVLTATSRKCKSGWPGWRNR